MLLALLLAAWKRLVLSGGEPYPPTTEELVDNATELTPSGHRWVVALMGFVAAGVFCVELSGFRFILFPPLVVIGFEMFRHTAACPWAKRPLWLPAACFPTTLGGFLLWKLLGVGPTAAFSMVWGTLVLRCFDLHVPPALAVALLPPRDGFPDHRLPDFGRHWHTVNHSVVPCFPASRGDTAVRFIGTRRSVRFKKRCDLD